MFRPIHLFNAFGIPIFVHSSLLIFLVIAGLLFGGQLGFVATVAFLTLVFGSVLLHELGHSVAALYHRIGVRSIVLYPIGGVAQLSRMPKDPRVELAVTAAGPAVNFVLAAILWLLGTLIPSPLVLLLMQANLVMGVFNLIPAFPMDGGRILRAFLSSRIGFYHATRIAAQIGKGAAVAMGIAALLWLQPMLVFISMFIFFAAGAEWEAVRRTQMAPARNVTLKDVFGNWFQKRESSVEQPSRPRRPTSWSGTWSAPRPEQRQTETVIEILPDGMIRRVR